jgi:carbon-monoxide dehydrogenase large subunit
MAKFGIGQAVTRVEDQRFLTGQGRYVDDIVLPAMAHGVNVLSPHAHAKIKRIDVSKAKTAPGVLAVLTGADAAAEKLGAMTAHLMPEDFGAPKGHRTFQPMLVSDRVRHVGDRVAFVVAETVEQARDAAELVELDYEPLPAIINIEDAAKPDAPKVWDDNPQGNNAFRLMFGSQEATDAAFAKAKHVVKLRVENNRISPVSMEPRVAIGDYDNANNFYTLYAASQNPHGLRMELSHVFHVAENQIRVVSPDVGGGFGLKGGPFPDDLLVMWASKKLRRPVKWVASRSESMLNDHHAREMVYYGELALDESGKILALRSKSLFQMGAYFVGAALAAGAFSIRFVPAAYDIQTMHIMSQGVFTNTSQSGPYRGAGRPEAAYVIERLVDAAARELDVAPDALRRKNFIRPKAMPYATATGKVYDTGDFAAHMARAQELGDWDGFKKRAAAAKRQGLIRGIGLSTYIEACGTMGPDTATITLDPDGGVTTLMGSQSSGQGHATSYAQIIADRLGIAPGMVRMVQGDTDRIETGAGTGGSSSIPCGGASLAGASEKLAENLKTLASAPLEASAGDLELADGVVRVVGTDRAIPLADLAKRPDATPDKLRTSDAFVPQAPTYPNGTHVAEVEIDPATGATRIVNYVVVDDFGETINPLLLAGQVYGGTVQGIGQALMEQTVYDSDSGQLITASLMDYALPKASDVPSFAFETRNVPCLNNPLGVKGAGEAGAIGSCPAIINAVVDALWRNYRIAHIDMPATPGRIWAAIEEHYRRERM